MEGRQTTTMPLNTHTREQPNVFHNSYQWQPPDTMNRSQGTTGMTAQMTQQLQRKIQRLERNLLQLLWQFRPKGIPVTDLWKKFKTIYKFQPQAGDYCVQNLNDLLPYFSKFIGIDQTPLGAKFVLTKEGERAYLKEFQPDVLEAQNSMSGLTTTAMTPMMATPRQYPTATQQMSYSQVATTNLQSNRRGQHDSPPSTLEHTFLSKGHSNIQPLTKETIFHALDAEKPKSNITTVKAFLAVPAWARPTPKLEEVQLDSQSRIAIEEFSVGHSEVEATIQKNLVAILAKFHPNGIAVRSIWAVYRKEYETVPTKSELLDNDISSINKIFERFSQTMVRKPIEESMNYMYILTDKGVDYAEKLDLLPKRNVKSGPPQIGTFESSANMTRQRQQGSSTAG